MSCNSSELHVTGQDSGARAFVAESISRGRERYLGFVARRVSNPAVAEDILQESTLRALERASSLLERGAFDGWFFRILRNAIIDFRRRSSAESRGKDAVLRQSSDVVEAKERTHRACTCVMPLVDSLKPTYRDALRRVEVDEVPVKAFAEEVGISTSNAGVRLHRARATLKEQVEQTCGACAATGCGDCTCG